MEKKEKQVLIVSIIALVLVLIGVTYAYFSARITGLESASMIQLTAGRMGIVYSEDDANVSVNNIYPRSEAWVTKTITLTGYNTTDQPMKYELGLNIISNTFKGGQLTFDLTGVGSNGTRIADITGKSITATSGYFKFGKGIFLTSDGDTHVYTLRIYFKDNGKDQNFNQEAIFNAKITAREDATPVNECLVYEDYVISYDINYDNCVTFETDWASGYLTSEQISAFCRGEDILYADYTENISDYIYSSLGNAQYMESEGVIENVVYGTQVAPVRSGLEYTNGQYTYQYSDFYNNWSMNLTDKNSTDPVTTKMCTSINGYPIGRMNALFGTSKASSIDLSSFDTSNVIDMEGMFYNISATNLDLSSFDTSNVTNMRGMFKNSSATNLDLSGFDTSNVTTMYEMFNGSAANSIDLSSFDTSNVTSMVGMFKNSSATSLDLSSFDTSKVTTMYEMFRGSAANSINLSGLDTSSVTTMIGMFRETHAASADFSSFDTSNVTDMSYMFQNSLFGNLNLNSFNTSNVTNMSYMFENTVSSNINVSSFDTSNVTNMSNMFYNNTNITTLDLSSFDTIRVTNFARIFYGDSNLRTIYTSNTFENSSYSSSNFFNGSSSRTINMFEGCTSLVGGAGTVYRFSGCNATSSSDCVDHHYARIDEGPSNPGYFTAK